MDKTSIFVISATVAILAARLYQKYTKKDKGKLGPDSNKSSGMSMSASSKEDDYEPYSKK
jgi:hypothetical protein